ncbi:MAG: type II toxin-antitoxin system HicB family antitoxin [Flavobacteriaceae bacterium]
MKFTALIEHSKDGWYVGQLEELPEVIAQGKSIAELKSNLLEGLGLVLDTPKI